SLNRYAYALNSPYLLTDPTGMMAEGYAAPTGAGAVSMSGFDEFSLFDTEVSGYSLDDPTESEETTSDAETPQNTPPVTFLTAELLSNDKEPQTLRTAKFEP